MKMCLPRPLARGRYPVLYSWGRARCKRLLAFVTDAMGRVLLRGLASVPLL